jgi:hypothetical protein
MKLFSVIIIPGGIRLLIPLGKKSVLIVIVVELTSTVTILYSYDKLAHRAHIAGSLDPGLHSHICYIKGGLGSKPEARSLEYKD